MLDPHFGRPRSRGEVDNRFTSVSVSPDRRTAYRALSVRWLRRSAWLRRLRSHARPEQVNGRRAPVLKPEPADNDRGQKGRQEKCALAWFTLHFTDPETSLCCESDSPSSKQRARNRYLGGPDVFIAALGRRSSDAGMTRLHIGRAEDSQSIIALFTLGRHADLVFCSLA